MEKLASTSTVIPPTHSFFPFTTRATFILNRTESTVHLSCHRTTTTTRTRHIRSKLFSTKQEFIGVQQQPEEEEEVRASHSDDDTPFLSLSEKPDRNMGLLDDYETEELDYDSAPNHRSGLSPFYLGFRYSGYLKFCLFCLLNNLVIGVEICS